MSDISRLSLPNSIYDARTLGLNMIITSYMGSNIATVINSYIETSSFIVVYVQKKASAPGFKVPRWITVGNIHWSVTMSEIAMPTFNQFVVAQRSIEHPETSLRENDYNAIIRLGETITEQPGTPSNWGLESFLYRLRSTFVCQSFLSVDDWKGLCQSVGNRTRHASP